MKYQTLGYTDAGDLVANEISFIDNDDAINSANNLFLYGSIADACIMEIILYQNGLLKIAFKNRKRKIIYQIKSLKFVQTKLPF